MPYTQEVKDKGDMNRLGRKREKASEVLVDTLISTCIVLVFRMYLLSARLVVV